MAQSKNRLLWSGMCATARAHVARLVGAPVVQAQNCPGGFSPGFASRLSLADGRRVFVKAIDTVEWPTQADAYRVEARVAAALPAAAAAPRLLGSFDDGHWVILAFEDITGTEPAHPWDVAELRRVAAAVNALSRTLTPSPIPLPREHPRLGGWRDLSSDRDAIGQLSGYSRWAADHLPLLLELEEEGLAAAQGSTLVHFDLYPHNILLTPQRVVFVDWPHARLGARILDLIITLSSAAADGIDPEAVLSTQADVGQHDVRAVDAIIAAHAGFLMVGGVYPPQPGLQPIVDTKLRLGLGALQWLAQRLTNRA